MVKILLSVATKLLIGLGGIGASQMCFGFLHEVEVPEELKCKN